nr:ATP-binding protein [Spirillospora albida]
MTALTELAGGTVSYTVPPDPESVTDARHFTLSLLREWGVPALTDDVGLVVSELVTNALRHGGAAAFDDREATAFDRRGTTAGGRPDGTVHRAGVYGDPADPLGSAPAEIRLLLTHRGPWVLCGIMDSSTAAPRRKEPDYIAETGRGLHLVDSFSVRWGWRPLHAGKVVWALFRCPDAP